MEVGNGPWPGPAPQEFLQQRKQEDFSILLLGRSHSTILHHPFQTISPSEVCWLDFQCVEYF